MMKIRLTDDNLESSVSESGCTGCQNAQDISLWLVLGFDCATVKAPLL